MKICFFDAHQFEEDIFTKVNENHHFEMTFVKSHLSPQTAILARNHEVVCVFTNDKVNREVLESLKENGIGLVALRCAGFNQIDVAAANEMGIKVVRVPEYSPYAIAEHVTALILTLNRKVHKAYNRVREGNFSLDGLVGFDLHQKTIGVIGTGKIGLVLTQIMKGFGMNVLAYDKFPNEEAAKSIGFKYTTLDEVLGLSDIISLHVPLNEETFHLIDRKRLFQMKEGVMIINTGRGGLIETSSLIEFLKNGHIGSAGLDVYEEEEEYFFKDLSSRVLTDDVLARLLTFPNVLLTSHQGFLTNEALQNIAQTTLESVDDYKNNRPLKNQVTAQ